MRIITKLVLLFVIVVGSLFFNGCGKAKDKTPKKRVFPIKLMPVDEHDICIKYQADVDVLNMKDVFTIKTEDVKDWPIVCFIMQRDIVLNTVAVNKQRKDVFIVDRYLNGDFPDYVPVKIVDHIKENANIFQVHLTDDMKEEEELQFIIHYSLYSQPQTDIYNDSKSEFTFNALDYWYPTNISKKEVVKLNWILPQSYNLTWKNEIQTPDKDEFFRVYNLTINEPHINSVFKGMNR